MFRVPTLRAVGAAAIAMMAFSSSTLLSPSAADAHGTTLPCQERTLRQVFAPWGDNNSYFLAPNGGFEGGSRNWELSGGAQVVSGNESFYVRSENDSKRLRLPAGGRAESRTICTERADRTIRFFVLDPQVRGAELKITVEVSNLEGTSSGSLSMTVGSGSNGRGWQPFQVIDIPATYGPAGQQALTVTFEATGTKADWYIDDVWVDPFKSI